ncbi:MAG: hypothetical protein O3A01_08625 [bacterium]|nr:hypothetical protein [bacterium]
MLGANTQILFEKHQMTYQMIEDLYARFETLSDVVSQLAEHLEAN